MKDNPQTIITEIKELFVARGWVNSILGKYEENKIIVYKDYFSGRSQHHKRRNLIQLNWCGKDNKEYEEWFLYTINSIMKKYNLKREDFIFKEQATIA